MLSLGRHYFRVRLIVLCVACALPSAGLILYEIDSSLNQSIRTAHLEMAGNAYQRPLEILLEKIPLYGLSVATGDPDGDVASALHGEIDEAFVRLLAVQERLGEDLQVTETKSAARPRPFAAIPSRPFPMPAVIERKWEALAAEAGRVPIGQWNADVDSLTRDVRELIAHIGDTSNLILDPDLATYYLMDMTLSQMPRTQERLAGILRLEGDIATGPSSASEARQKLAIEAAMLGEIDLSAILGDAQTSLAANSGNDPSPSLQKNLPAALAPYQAANQALLLSLRQLAAGASLPPAGSLQEETQRLRAQSFQLWNTAVTELDLLLQHRIDRFLERRIFYILLTLATLAAAFSLAWLGLRAENLREANEKLEQKVAERTGELKAAYQELEMFSYSVSHDLRSPLRGIDSLCSTLVAKHGAKLEPEARGYLQKIEAATGRMGQIIDDLLLLSRVARSKLTLQPVDLSALSTRIAGELQVSAPARAVRFEIAPGLSGWGDYRLLQNVLENLLGNAWKYTGRKAEARIVFDCIEKEGRPVFRVKDNGAGFDMRFVQKLFQNFQRLHDQTEFEGTGIGLAIVARIIRRHGGEVWAEGAVGEGATFSFTLGDKQGPSPSERAFGSANDRLA